MQKVDMKLYGLEGKVAIVTGGGAGLGKGMALEMAKAGASVVIVEIDQERAESTVNEIKGFGARAISIVADVLKTDQVDRMVKGTLEEFGNIHVLVNNVGGVPGVRGGMPFLEMNEDFWDNIINVNLKGAFLCSKAVVKVMIEKGVKGSIINISSITGLYPWAGVLPYGVAKAGLINMTTTMAVDLGKHGIRVNAIAPGRMETPLTAELYRGMTELRQAQVRSIPMGRFGLPEDIGRAAVSLASDASSYISGQTLIVSGAATHLFVVAQQ